MLPFKKFFIFPVYRTLICWFRFIYFVFLRRRLKTVNSEESFSATVQHNLKNLTFFSGRRMDTIFHPLSVLENIDKNHAKALVVGPRNEADLLSLMGFGFQKKNVEGLDLISYSPMIQVGDIHNTNFKNDQFDVLVAGWVLSYSKNQPKFANECLRIVKNGGVIAIGVEYTEMNAEDELSTVGYSIVDQQTAVIQTTKAILDLFGSHIDHVYFNHDAPLKRSHQKNNLIENPSSVVVIFSIKK